MANPLFGDMLRDARERKGYDVETVARRLHLNRNTIQAIENSDLSSMPPRGYARNMINAYARLVDLDPSFVTNSYLSAAGGGRTSAYGAISDAPRSAYSTRGEGGYSSDRSRRRTEYADAYDEGRPRRSSRASGAYGADDGMRRSSRRMSRHDNDASYDDGSSRLSRGGTLDNSPSAGVLAAMTGAASNLVSAFTSAGGSRSNVFSSGSGRSPMMANTYRGSSMGGPVGGIMARLPLIGVVVLVLILLIIIFSLLGGGGGQASDEVTTAPITGLDDTTDGEAKKEADEEAQKAVAPANVTFTFTVADGEDAYIEVYLDGSENPEVFEVFSGPVEQSFDVTGSLYFATAAPEPVTIKVDGKDVELQADPNGTGLYTYSLSYEEFLNQWYEEHPEVKRPTSNNDVSNTDDSTDGESTDEPEEEYAQETVEMQG